MATSTAFIKPPVPCLYEIVGAVGHWENAKSFWSYDVYPVVQVEVHESFDRCLDLGRLSPKVVSIGIFDILWI
jgi:hypothetical protein